MKTIVEVGAHQGVETLNFLAEQGKRIFAFEPDHDSFRVLQEIERQYSLSGLRVLPFAVDLGDNQETLFHYPDGKSTLANPFFREEKPAGFSLVWTMRLDTFMDLYNIDKIDYLRIDAPLHEESCLESLGTRVKDVERGRIRAYEDQNLLRAWLKDHGFNTDNDMTENKNYLPDVRFWR
jgi:FkbM family methyltransferase